MKTVSIHDAKTNLSKYIAAAKNGEKIFIGGFGRAEVVLTKISNDGSPELKPRVFTAAKGKVAEKADSFSRHTDQIIASLLLGDD